MPILLMALLALLVFGLIGILLSAAVILEQSKRKHSPVECRRIIPCLPALHPPSSETLLDGVAAGAALPHHPSAKGELHEHVGTG